MLCPLPSWANLPAGVCNVPTIDAAGPEQLSQPGPSNWPCKNVREKPMLESEATATLPSHILIPLHVVCAFATLQEAAAQTLAFTLSQCRRSICVSRQPFPLPHISFVQDFDPGTCSNYLRGIVCEDSTDKWIGKSLKHLCCCLTQNK